MTSQVSQSTVISDFQLFPIEQYLVDLDSIIRNLQSSGGKLDGLNELSDALGQGCSTASFLSQLELLFSGLRACLQVDHAQMEIILKVNQILIDMLPDIQHSDELEIQIAQLMPVLIENLGSPKAVVRKSTHKCIATYVKLSKKLEFVILHLIHTGLESPNTRTRQHSMLVVPALLSLKPSVLDKCAPEIVEMVKVIIKKLRDPQDIVAKTSRKLLLEINKCYPIQFENQIMQALKSEEEKLICKAVLRNDEDEIQRVLTQTFQQQIHVRKQSEEIKQAPSSYGPQSSVQNLQSANKSSLINPQPGKELSIVGKEILSSGVQSSQIGTMQILDKIITQAKEESRYPQAQNGLYFGILEESIIEALNENNQWKDRTNAIEAIESKLNMVLVSEKKVDFMPYATPFLGFMIQYIPDINFKISLSSIKIISKLLSMNLINYKKYYQQLVSALIEKLSDSKVVIRQAVLKCCSLLITNYKASTFAFHAMRYLQHNNWHVREGALQLIIHSLISQGYSKTPEDNLQIGSPDYDQPLQNNPTLIQEVCSLLLTEDKQKNQGYAIDLLAMILDKSVPKQKNQQMIQKHLGISSYFSSDEDTLAYNGHSKECLLYKQIIERLHKENFPYVNEEGLVEFPQNLQALNNISQKTSTMAQQATNVSSTKNFNQIYDEETKAGPQSQTLASNLRQAPSQNFLEMKKKQEEEKKTFQAPAQQQPIPSYYSKFSSNAEVKTNIDDNIRASKETDKIAMWLPSFNHQANSTPIENRNSLSKKLSTNSTQLKETDSSYTASSSNHQDTSSYRQTGLSLPQSSTNFGSNIDRFGYTPEQHQTKPRTIQSNELRQRTVESMKSDQDYYNQKTNNSLQSDFKIHQAIPFQKNMSQSTGGIGGFKNREDNGPYVNDRLQLLKSNSKYKDSSPTKYNDMFDSQEDNSLPNEVQDKFSSLNKPANQRKFGNQPDRSFNGPVKATHQEFLQTIHTEDQQNDAAITPLISKTRKPPLTTKTSVVQTKAQTRAQSVDTSGSISQSNDQNPNDIYTAVEEPLQNPEKQISQALDQLKSGDWSMQFEGCNIVKRATLFHQQLLSYQNPIQPQIVKELVKLVDNLRSQLSKNSMLTIKQMVENLPAKDMDPLIDQLLPALIKKAADTNIFISESADAALVAICSQLSESKVFTSLQSVPNVKSNMMKAKMALCYNTLIDKLGPRIRQFVHCDRLIQALVSLLNEGAIEVRNMAKLGLFSLKNSFSTQRELEGLLNRCVSNEKQLDKIKQILDKTDVDSLSNSGSTRYGTSMRNSSLDTRSAGPFRGSSQHASGSSDGFGKFTASSDFNKSTASVTIGGPQGFNTTSNTFKKQNNLVSKPIDPMIMEEFKQIIGDIGTSDWNKRLKTIDNLSDFTKNNINVIKSAPPAKFIQLIDAYCKVLNDNNAKVLSHAQQSFRVILLNQDLKGVIEQNLTMIVQALNNNLQSTNASVREQGDILFSLLEGAVDANLLIPPFIAQINLANNRSKAQLVDRLANLIERVDKVAMIQKYVSPLLQQSNKIHQEAATNAKLKEALQRLQYNVSGVL